MRGEGEVKTRQRVFVVGRVYRGAVLAVETITMDEKPVASMDRKRAVAVIHLQYLISHDVKAELQYEYCTINALHFTW